MPTFTEIATGVGAAIGSAAASYAVMRRKRGQQGELDKQKLDNLEKDFRALTGLAASLSERVTTLERRLNAIEGDPRASRPELVRDWGTEVREIRMAVETFHRQLREFLTIEEFQAYVTLDGQKRERLIERVAELKGTVDATIARLFQNMRG